MKITADSKSFTVEGQRQIILSGEIHYFRLPKLEWKTALMQIRDCGLNTVSTYIPWNYHEITEGKWDFKGDRDLEGFLNLCKQLGLLCIAKPGPYIRADWDFGAFPAWLHQKGVRYFRTSDLSYLNAVDRYLDKILTILARHEIRRGGPIFLVQIEDIFDEAPQDPAYLRHLENRFKKRLSVPVYFSLGDTSLGGGYVCGAMIAACAYENSSRHLARVRELAGSSRQPLMLSQFWVGAPSLWGQEQPVLAAQDIESRLNEALSAGAGLINLAPFCGGTNFGTWAGRGVGGDHAFTTTSWDCGAPLNEGLQKTSKALALALWARTVLTLEPALLGSERLQEEHPVVPEEVEVIARAKDEARLYFLRNPSNSPLSGKIQVEDPIPFTLQPGECRVFAFNLSLTPNLAARACSHPYFSCQLGTRTVVVLWGQPGQKLQFWGNGTLELTERTHEVIQLEHERKGFLLSAEISEQPQKLLAKILFEHVQRDILFLILTRTLAEHCALDLKSQKLVVGSSEVDFERKRIALEPGDHTLIVASEHGFEEQYLHAKRKESLLIKVAPAGTFPEAELLHHLQLRKDWKEAAPGKDLSEYGFLNSRAWYRLTFQARQKGKRMLVIPALEDGFAAFAQGAYLGLFGRLGKGLSLEVPMQPGKNHIYLLCYHWGRYSLGTKLGEKKGLLSPIFERGEIQNISEGWHLLEAAGPLDFKIFSSPTFTGRGWEIDSLPKILERNGFVCARKKFRMPDWSRRVRLHLHAGDVQIQVALNGQAVGQHPGRLGSQYQEFDLTPYLIKEENTLVLFFKGPSSGFQHSELLFLGMEFKAKLEVCEGVYAPEETNVLKHKGWSRRAKGRFGFWKSSFKTPPFKDLASAWLRFQRHGRGSFWLNGQPLGRHWNAGPQKLWKLPLSWLKPKNELLVLEEEAGLPQSAEVIFHLKPRWHPLPPTGR